VDFPGNFEAGSDLTVETKQGSTVTGMPLKRLDVVVLMPLAVTVGYFFRVMYSLYL
jgi:hypothetical protein